MSWYVAELWLAVSFHSVDIVYPNYQQYAYKDSVEENGPNIFKHHSVIQVNRRLQNDPGKTTTWISDNILDKKFPVTKVMGYIKDQKDSDSLPQAQWTLLRWISYRFNDEKLIKRNVRFETMTILDMMVDFAFVLCVMEANEGDTEVGLKARHQWNKKYMKNDIIIQ